MEPAAWTIPGFLVRRSVSALAGGRTCSARRCGMVAQHDSRFCHLHVDILIAQVGVPEARYEARLRLRGLSAGVMDRLERWASWKLNEGLPAIDLTPLEDRKVVPA